MRAPSTSANLGSGFDVVAVAHDAYFAEAYVKVGSGCGVHVRFCLLYTSPSPRD